MRIMISGGGTGGHIYPALALVQELKNRYDDIEILYIGKEGSLEEELTSKEDISFKSLKIRGFYRRVTLQNFITVYEFVKAVFKAKKMIVSFKPDLIIGTGGYVSAPVLYAGSKRKIPTIIHEQNSIPGLTNKFLSRYVTKIAISFESSKPHFKADRVVLTGNPRAQIVKDRPYTKKEELGFDRNKKLIIFVCGSLGAKYVNDSIIKTIPTLIDHKDYEVLYITGKGHYDSVVKELSAYISNKRLHIKSFVYNLPDLYKVSSLIVCRAGATTLSEITAIGIPAILIPSPYVTANHQELNASDLVNNKAAMMITEPDLNSERLLVSINQLLEDTETLNKYRINSKKIGIPDSLDRFIALIESIRP
ncbi:undecaprenyldiphospho-muramoylpentapeptide beta-N-acetylglucosaminyltransferase [Haloplasma contractile]|uniref:UDP-N-acetylglucosamine--N-acetylmuramyl-(pentapeptide) pyrophosphoryl-undecaprenol N-acetylglucosamine transferase n=1 Tax=Haloplasma contractile SSD-17B TaxID=1033810 RepID=F7PVJ6_9MOLU|nr:undecaprenyldiphospho-muramoylpentapeptide beta-N-acetylglucosaminyltransferase [Haloplasma contractile]ERJ12836.1 pyrophosphoryl-undecaprenol N-acetylglucosamine transferase 1 protein [Haloplasma contractile SSD-17B]